MKLLSNYVLSLIVCINCVAKGNCQVSKEYFIELQTVSDCASGSEDFVHQLYDISKLQCRDCIQNSSVQTVSGDGRF